MSKATLREKMSLIVAGLAAFAALDGCSSENRSNQGDATTNAGVAVAGHVQPDLAALTADPAEVERGRQLFSTCSVCHTIAAGAPSPAGPNLHGVLGRQIASISDFPYSEGLKNAQGSWTSGKLDAFLKNPQAAFPGTAMGFGGLAKPQDRKAVIAYLASESKPN